MPDEFIYGLKAIGSIVKREPQTVRRWIRIHGFPASKAPNGQWMTTPSLMRIWILSRTDKAQHDAETAELS